MQQRFIKCAQDYMGGICKGGPKMGGEVNIEKEIMSLVQHKMFELKFKDLFFFFFFFDLIKNTGFVAKSLCCILENKLIYSLHFCNTGCLCSSLPVFYTWPTE